MNSDTTIDQNTTEAQTTTTGGHPFGDDYSGFQRDLLYVIADTEGSHGLGIKQVLQTYYGDNEVHHGRLYPNLDRLVERGLVEKTAVDRRTNEYRLTDEGREILERHHEWNEERLGGGGA